MIKRIMDLQEQVERELDIEVEKSSLDREQIAFLRGKKAALSQVYLILVQKGITDAGK